MESVVFTYLFDAEVFRLKTTLNEKIKPGRDIVWNGEMSYNCFIDQHRIFDGFKKDDMKLIFEESDIIFE